MDAIRLTATSRIDRDNNRYYFTIPSIPCSVDLSKVVLFVYPWVEGDKHGADIVIKPHTEKEDKPADNPVTTP